MIFSGDWRFFWPENLGVFAHIPFAWDSSLNTGLGISALGSLWFNTYFYFTAFFSRLGLSWFWIEMLFYVIPAIIFSFFSAFYLFNSIFPGKKLYSFLSGLIFILNTYFLLILTGGQLGVALAYSIIPLIFLVFKKTFEKPTLKRGLIAGLALSLQTIFDPRIVYISLVIIFLFWIFCKLERKLLFRQIIFSFFIPFLITILINSFWIIPIIFTKTSPLPSGFDSMSGLKFLSFASLSNSISLLHPNWPDNIFGKVYFMRPEFLLIPIFSFGSLLFFNFKNEIKAETKRTTEKDKIILFFVFLSLIGAFLAKGVNEPFGELYGWLFQFFPGFKIFRDPTKWYTLIALSYSILIPVTLFKIEEWFRLRFTKSKLIAFSPLLIIFYLLFLTYPLIRGQFQKSSGFNYPPSEYVQLKNFLINTTGSFRTLWIPDCQRFGYFSDIKPSICGKELFKNSSASNQLDELNKDNQEQKLQELSIKYLIVPYDSEKEIFLKDRKYDETQYLAIIKKLEKISWLKNKKTFGKIVVFEINNIKPRFFSADNQKLNWTMISPVHYQINTKSDKIGSIIFNEAYNLNWVAYFNGLNVNSDKYGRLINIFRINQKAGIIDVYYKPQKFVDIGIILGLSTILITVGILIIKKND